MGTRLSIAAPADFRLARDVCSYGYFRLAPDRWDVPTQSLHTIFDLPEAREALAFRGGTALYKLHLTPPARYSEDIDLVQVAAGPIGGVSPAPGETSPDAKNSRGGGFGSSKFKGLEDRCFARETSPR